MISRIIPYFDASQYNTTQLLQCLRNNGIDSRCALLTSAGAQRQFGNQLVVVPQSYQVESTPLSNTSVDELYQRPRSMEVRVKVTIPMMKMMSLNPLITVTTMMIEAAPLNARSPRPICEACWSCSGNSSGYSSSTRK
jgi:hypothetical protein